MTACICRLNLQEVVRPSRFSETNHHRNVPGAGRPSNAGYDRDSDRLSQSLTETESVQWLSSAVSFIRKN